MNTRISATLAALSLCVCSAAASHAQSQSKESTPTFSIFGGRVLDGSSGRSPGALNSMEFGGSGDFRLSALPVPLRATLAFRREDRPYTLSPMKFGTLSLDAVFKPIPRIFGIQPYLLGGLGVATSADYLAASYDLGLNGQITSTGYRTIQRHTWAFAEGGLGFELGRHVFIQTRIMAPVASQGPILVPFSVGFRFWD